MRSQDSEAQQLLDAIQSEAFEKGRQKGIREGLIIARQKLDELIAKLGETQPVSDTQLSIEPVSPEADISNLGLRMRVIKPLRRAGINTVSDLVSKTPADLYDIRGIGSAAYNSIEVGLALHGFALKAEEPYYSRDPGDYA